MNFPLTELLILIFILAPLVQRWLDKRKQKEREAARKTGANPVEQQNRQDESLGEKEELDWQDALRELETIFTGEEVEEEAIQPEIAQIPVPKPERDQRSMRDPVNSRPNVRKRDPGPQSYSRTEHAPSLIIRGADISAEHLDQKFKKSAADLMSEPLTTTEFQDELQIEFNVRDDIKNTTKLRDYYVLKEILDEPVARKERLYHRL